MHDDMFDIEPVVIKYMFKAYCTSEVCSAKARMGRSEIGVAKEVRKTQDECPDCGHYLYWDRKAA